MVGRELSDRYPSREHNISDKIGLEVNGWTVHHPIYTEKKVVDNVSFNVHRGEIVGFSGLQGAGRTELAMSIFGRSYGSDISGELMIDGKPANLKTVREAIEAGLAYVTEDRKGNGLILTESIARNTTMARLEKVCNKGIIDVDKENAVADEYKERLRTKTPTVQQSVGNLSGGNQQKVLLSKWMFADPEVLILDEPTRGIDVGAKYEIYCIMNDLVAQGKSVVMISSEKVFIVLVVVTVAELISDALAHTLDGMHQMMLLKKRQRTEYIRFVNGQNLIFQFRQCHRMNGLGQFPDHDNSIGCRLNAVLLQ